MKKITKYILLSLIVAGLTISCSDELEKLPPQSLPTELALSTEENVLRVLIGAYNALSNSDLFGGEILRNSELLAADDEIIFSGTFNAPSEIWRKEILTTNADVSEVWLDGYNTINIANNVLKAVADGVVVNDADIVEGEALFIRGIIYFELVKYFGKPYSDGNAATNPGVPIITTPTAGIDENSFVSRNTVQEVYAQAEADLTRAASLLPASNGEFANSVAAYAILARIALQKADYNASLAATNSAFSAATGNYILVPIYEDAFNKNSNSFEDIFSIQVTTTDGVNAIQLYYAPQALNGRGDIEVQPRHANFYDPADARLAFHYADPTTGETRVGKWQDEFGNVGAIRMAELYLNRAECNFRLSGANTSVDDDINILRTRAGLGNITVTDLNQIFLERKLELAHEGHAIHDFKRTQGAFYNLVPAFGVVDASGDGQVDGYAYDADLLVFPIPDREVQVNTNLTQNPSY